MKCLKLIFVLMILVAAGGMVQAQSVQCSLTTFWVDQNPFASSSRHLVGKFPLVIEDEPIAKVLRHDDSGINVSIGIEILKGIFNGEPTRIRLAIAFLDKPKDVFEDVAHSEAESIYNRNWRWLSVSRSVAVEKRVYTFTFGCERKNSRRR